MLEPDAEPCQRQARAVPLSASTPPQDPTSDAGARSQHGSYANDYHNDNPAPEESVPPIGDECQLPLDFAQAYGITAIRVLTTSQAPAWSANSFIGAETLQDLAVVLPAKGHGQLKNGQIIPVPVVRVVVDGQVTHQFRWSHPSTGVIDPHSETAGPLISPSTARCAVLRNVSPSIATCLSGCQHLPMRAVRAEGQTSGLSGIMEHGSLCMLVIYGRRMAPAAPPAVSRAQLPSNLAGRLKRINSMLGRSTGASSIPSPQPAGTSTHTRHQPPARSGEPPTAKASVEGRAQSRPRRKCAAPSSTPGGTPATSSVTAPPAVTAQQPQQVNLTGSKQAGTAHVSGSGMPRPTLPPSPGSISQKKRKRRQSEAAAQQMERSGTGVLDAGAEGPTVGRSAEGQISAAVHAPPPASPPPPATPYGVSTTSSKRRRLNTPAEQPSSTPHASPSSKRVLRNTAARQARAQAQAQQQPANPQKRKEKSCTKRSLYGTETSIAGAPDASAGRAWPADQHLADPAGPAQEQAPVPHTSAQLVDSTRNKPRDEAQTAATGGQASSPLAGMHQGPPSTKPASGTAANKQKHGLQHGSTSRCPHLAHQPRHSPSSRHHYQQHMGAGEEEEAPHSPEPDVGQGTAAAAAAPAALLAPVTPPLDAATAASVLLRAAPVSLPLPTVLAVNGPAIASHAPRGQVEGALGLSADITHSDAPGVPFWEHAQELPVTADALAPPVVPIHGGALSPAGEECQLPADFIQAYGIQTTQVLTSREPLSSTHCSQLKRSVVHQLGISFPDHQGLAQPLSIPIPILRVVVNGTISHQSTWSYPITHLTTQHLMGLTKQQAVSVFPDGCIGMRNITPPLSTLLEGCEQLPARAVRAMGATSGVIGSMQPGALCMLVVYAKTTPAGDECQLPADFAESYGIRATKVLTTREAPAWGPNAMISGVLLAELGISFPEVGSKRSGRQGRSIPVPLVRVVIDGVVTHETNKPTFNVSNLSPLLTMHPGGLTTLTNVSPSIHALLRGCQRQPMRAVKAVGRTSGPAGTMQHGALCMLVVYGKRMHATGPAGTTSCGYGVEGKVVCGAATGMLQHLKQGPGAVIDRASIQGREQQAAGEHGATPAQAVTSPALTLHPAPCAAEASPQPGTVAASSVHHQPAAAGGLDMVALASTGVGITGQPQSSVEERFRPLHAPDACWTEPDCLVPHTQASLGAPPVEPDGEAVLPHVVSAVLPPAGEECQLPDDFVKVYGIRSTQVLTSNEPPLSPNSNSLRAAVLHQLNIKLPKRCSLRKPTSIPVPVLRVVVDGTISHQSTWPRPIKYLTDQGLTGLTEEPAITAFPSGINFRNIRPTFQTLLKGCEQLPARAVRAGSDTSGTAGTIQRGALCMLVVYAKRLDQGFPQALVPAVQQHQQQHQPVDRLIADVDRFLSSLQQGGAVGVPAAQGPRVQVSHGTGGLPLAPALLAPAVALSAAPMAANTELLAEQGAEADDILPTGPDWVVPTATRASFAGRLRLSTGTGVLSPQGLLDPTQQGTALSTGGAGQASTMWPAAALPSHKGPLWDGSVPPVGEECTPPPDFAESYGIQSTQVLTTSAAPKWGGNALVPGFLLAELGISFPGMGSTRNGRQGRSIPVPMVRVVIDGVVSHEMGKSYSQASNLSPLLTMHPGGQTTFNVTPPIHALLRGCQRQPVRAVKAVGRTSGPAGTMQHGTLCMLVIYGKRMHATGPADGIASPATQGGMTIAGMAPPVEPRAAEGLGQCFLPSNAAQEAGPHAVSHVTQNAAEQTTGQASGQEQQGTSSEPSSGTTPALAFGCTPVPAPAAPIDESLGLGFAAPGSVSGQPAVPSDDDAGAQQMPAPLLPEGRATTQPQLAYQVSGLHVDGSTSQSAPAGHPQGCIPQSAVQTAVPHAVPAGLPPPRDECALPAAFIVSYGIRETKVLTTRQAPAWGGNGFMSKPVRHDLGISLTHGSRDTDHVYLAVPIVRVVIDGMVTHQAQWSRPPPLGVVRGSPAVKMAGPSILNYGRGHNAYLQKLSPNLHAQLRGCERLPARAVRAVGTTSGPAGTMQDGGLCMLVIYAKRTQLGELPASLLGAGAATEGTVELGGASEGSGQGFILADAAQEPSEAGPQPVPESTETPAGQAAEQAAADNEGTQSPSSPAPNTNPTSLPAPAAPADECLGLGSDAPGGAHHQPAVYSGDGGDLQMPAPLLPEGPATGQPQPQVGRGLTSDGSTSPPAQAARSEDCVSKPAVHPAAPDVLPAVPDVAPAVLHEVHPAVLPPPGEECALPAEIIVSYGIRETKVLTTCQAPAWGKKGRINTSGLHDLGISFPDRRNGDNSGTLSLAVPIVRVVIDSMVTHQAQWSHPIPLGVVRGRLAREAGPMILQYVGGQSTYLKKLSPSIHILLRGCERLSAKAVRAVNTTSGPAGTMQDGGLCMLVIYGRRVQPAELQPDRHTQQQQQPTGLLASEAAPASAAVQATRGGIEPQSASLLSHPATSLNVATESTGHVKGPVMLNLGEQDAPQPAQSAPPASLAHQPMLPFPNLPLPALGGATRQPANATGGAAALPLPLLQQPPPSPPATEPPLPQSGHAVSGIPPAGMALVAGAAAPPAGRPEGTCTAEVRPAGAGVLATSPRCTALAQPDMHASQRATLSLAAAAAAPIAPAAAEAAAAPAAGPTASESPLTSPATGEGGPAHAVCPASQPAAPPASERLEPGVAAGHAQGLLCPAVPQPGGDGITDTTSGCNKRGHLGAPADWPMSATGQSDGAVPGASEPPPVGALSPTGIGASGAPQPPSPDAAALMSRCQACLYAAQAGGQQRAEHASCGVEVAPAVANDTMTDVTGTGPVGTALTPAVPDPAPPAAGNTTAGSAGSNAGGPTAVSLAEDGALGSAQDEASIHPQQPSAAQQPASPPHLPLASALPDLTLPPASCTALVADASAGAGGALRPEPTPPPPLMAHPSALVQLLTARALRKALQMVIGAPPSEEDHAAGASAQLPSAHAVPGDPHASGESEGRAAPPPPPPPGRPAGSSAAGGHAAGPVTQVTDPPTAHQVPGAVTGPGMGPLSSATDNPALRSPAASRQHEKHVRADSPATTGSREQRCNSYSAPPPAAGHLPHQLGEPAHSLSAESAQGRHPAALPLPSPVSAAPLLAGAAATATSPPPPATQTSPVPLFSVADAQRGDQPDLLPSPSLPPKEQVTAPSSTVVCEQSTAAPQQPCTASVAVTAPPLVPGQGPSAGNSNQPPQARDTGNAAGCHQLGAPSITTAVKSLSLPPIDLPRAGLTDTTRAYLCQQLVRSLLAAARALYATQPDSRLDTLVQQLLEVPAAHLLQFLERRYEVLRMAMEVQPNPRMAEVAGRLLHELCGLE